MPEDIKAIFRDALTALEESFFEAVEDFGDHTEEDISEFETRMAAATAWLDAN